MKLFKRKKHKFNVYFVDLMNVTEPVWAEDKIRHLRIEAKSREEAIKKAKEQKKACEIVQGIGNEFIYI